MFVSWCLLVALMGTTCLIVLPLTVARKSRFENFLRKVISIHIGSPFLEKIKPKARVYLIVFSVICVAAMVGTILTDAVLGLNVGKLEPWDSWFGFRITSLLFFTYGAVVWILPLPFFCITCFILETLFDDLHKRMSSQHSNSVGIAALRREHQNLCQVNLRQEEFAYLGLNLFWLLTSSTILGIIMIVGSRVSEKIRKKIKHKKIFFLHFYFHF